MLASDFCCLPKGKSTGARRRLASTHNKAEKNRDPTSKQTYGGKQGVAKKRLRQGECAKEGGDLDERAPHVLHRPRPLHLPLLHTYSITNFGGSLLAPISRETGGATHETNLTGEIFSRCEDDAVQLKLMPFNGA